jgi:hypothetical protein
MSTFTRVVLVPFTLEVPSWVELLLGTQSVSFAGGPFREYAPFRSRGRVNHRGEGLISCAVRCLKGARGRAHDLLEYLQEVVIVAETSLLRSVLERLAHL